MLKIEKNMRLIFFLIIANFTFAIGQEVIYDEHSRIVKVRIWNGETNTPSDEWDSWSELRRSNHSWKFFFHKKIIHWSTGAMFVNQYEWSNMIETYEEPGFEGKRVLKFNCNALDSYTAKGGYNWIFWLVYHDDKNVQLYLYSELSAIIANVSQRKD
jgi:hypothetical protein